MSEKQEQIGSENSKRRQENLDYSIDQKIDLHVQIDDEDSDNDFICVVGPHLNLFAIGMYPADKETLEDPDERRLIAADIERECFFRYSWAKEEYPNGMLAENVETLLEVISHQMRFIKRDKEELSQLASRSNILDELPDPPKEWRCENPSDIPEGDKT